MFDCSQSRFFRNVSSSSRSWSLIMGRGLADKAFLEVPLQVFRVGVVSGAFGHHGQWLVVQFVVGLAIEPLVLDLAAHPHPKLGRYGHESSIEEFMEIGAHQHPARDPVRAAFGIGLDPAELRDRYCAASNTGKVDSPVIAQRFP